MQAANRLLYLRRAAADHDLIQQVAPDRIDATRAALVAASASATTTDATAQPTEQPEHNQTDGDYDAEPAAITRPAAQLPAWAR
jgi:hypothetical protein